MSGHTPGPWRLSRHGPSGLTYGVEAGPSHDPVRIVKWGGIGRPSSQTGQANARLIAAAPDLLSSHGRLLANFRLLLAGKPVRDVAEMYAEAEAAIAKATGEQP